MFIFDKVVCVILLKKRKKKKRLHEGDAMFTIFLQYFHDKS